MMDKIVDVIFGWWGALVGTLLIVLFAGFLTGCASSDGYQRYLQAQSAAIKAQKPMLRITAEKGQAITGLASIEVYGPGMSIQQERPNEWAAVVSSGINVLGVVGGIVAAGQASQDLVNAVGGLGTNSTVIDNSLVDNRTTDRHDIANSYNPIDSTHAPTVVTQPAPLIVTQPQPIVVQPQVVVIP
jgi:hypothetical protein